MVAIFSGDYFDSEWCNHELDLMLGRSMAIGRDCRLIIPIVVHDGERIPDELGRIQPAQFDQFRTAHIIRGTPDYVRFSEAMKALAPKITRAIESAPPLDPNWLNECTRRFNAVYDESRRGNRVPVQHFHRKPRPVPLTPPRATP
jgi:hypothetical protein